MNRRKHSGSVAAEAKEGLITVEEAARRLGIKRSTAYELISEGELPAIRFKRQMRVEPAAVEKFIADHRVKAQKALAPLPKRPLPKVSACGLGTDRYVL